MSEDADYIAWSIQYQGEGAFVSLPTVRVRALLDEVKRLNRIVAEYRSRETLPFLGVSNE